jgi:DeoR/GlpR family transcriptional regulator of sugar metabolism
MLANQRHDLILELIRRQGSVRVRDLVNQLNVSDMTVRRDLDVLAERQLVEKVHGGATLVGNRTSFEPGFEAKRLQQQDEKQRIATASAEFVHPGNAIGLTAGTTTWTLASLLVSVPELTVVTNSPSIAQIFYQDARADQTIVLTGGIRTPSDALVGPLAVDALRQLHVDTVFMGVHGMEQRAGFTTPNLAEAELNSAFIDAAEKVVVAADHTKWGVRGLARIAPLGRADVIVTDGQLADDATSAIAEADIELVTA